MTTEARANLGPPATSPTHTPRNTHRLVARSGHGGNLSPRRPDTPRAAASLANRWSTDGPQTAQRLAAHFGLFRRCHDHRPPMPEQNSGLQQPSPTASHRALCRLDAPRAKAATCHLDVQTHFGPSPSSPADGPGARCPLRSSSGHGGNLPPRRPDTSRAAAIFTSRRISGVRPPTCPPPTSHNPMPSLLPLLPLPANPGSVPRQDAPLPS